jgi:ATP-binding cassette subfamily C protein CydC
MIIAGAPHLTKLLQTERRRQASTLRLAAACSMVAVAAATLLLGLSGWFIVGASLAGVAGLVAAQTFNYLLPAAAIRLLAILRTGSRYLERVSGHEAALKALANIRPALFAALAAAPPDHSLSLSSGEASARLVQDVGALETLFIRQTLPWTLTAALVTGLSLATLAGPAPAIGLALFAGLSVMAARWLGAKAAKAAGGGIQIRTGELKDRVASLAAAAPELRCYGLEDWAADEIDRRGRALGAMQLSMVRAQGQRATVQTAVLGGGVAVVIALASGAATPLAVMAGLAAVMTLESLAGALRILGDNGAVGEAARRLEPVLASAPHERSASLLVPTIAVGPASFAPRERIAIIGMSGAGKTTLIERLIGLRRAPAGLIRVGGLDLAAMDAGAARGMFAYAPQDAALLSGTVRDNLALACADADEPSMWAVLGDAALDARVRRMPQGLDTWIGENGARLSGGERRRLSLARALLRPAPWLLLDEPTEGLDAATEALVLERLQLRLNRTGQGVLIASHRPAPLRLCQRTIDVARGTPDLPPPEAIFARNSICQPAM